MRLYLDDLRPTPEGFTHRAYTAKQAIEFLKTGEVEFISFDHDLGTKGCGYDVAKWIEHQAAYYHRKPPAYDVHSKNPVGSMNIIWAMENAHQLYMDLGLEPVEECDDCSGLPD